MQLDNQFNDILILLGYVVLFASAFPAAATIAWAGLMVKFYTLVHRLLCAFLLIHAKVVGLMLGADTKISSSVRLAHGSIF